MMIPPCANLHELDSPPEMIDHLLIPGVVPPLYRNIKLPPGADDPERYLFSRVIIYFRIPIFFLSREINIPANVIHSGARAQLAIDQIQVGFNIMPSPLARSINRAGTSIRSATSASRSELLLFGEPMTSILSHSVAIALTAAWRLEVA